MTAAKIRKNSDEYRKHGVPIRMRRRLFERKLASEAVQILRARRGLEPFQPFEKSAVSDQSEHNSRLILAAIEQSSENADKIEKLRELYERDILFHQSTYFTTDEKPALRVSVGHAPIKSHVADLFSNFGLPAAFACLAYLSLMALDGFFGSFSSNILQTVAMNSEIHQLTPEIGLIAAVCLTVFGYIWIQKD